MDCSPISVVIIQGCREGVPVYKREFYRADGVIVESLTSYSDDGDDTDWVPGACPVETP
jgi:hypothetical protein